MPNPPKMIQPGACYSVTSRTEEGLPFIDAEKYKPICEAIMARGQELYPVTLGAYHLGANQLHLILGAIVPEDFTSFVGYVKQELAHVVNKENYRRKKTIWCEGYDSPVLLGFEEAVYYTEYIYSQPVKDGVTSTVSEYLGANGYNGFLADIKESVHQRIYRTVFEERAEEVSTAQEHILRVEPLFWLASLGAGQTRESVKERIIDYIKEIQIVTAQERKAKGLKLKSNCTKKKENYVPKKFGRRMRCICWDKETRIGFLSWMSEKLAECKQIYRQWKAGDLSVPWPEWFFPPIQPRRVSPWPVTSVLELATA